jgi:hypothetical protein
MIGIQTVMVGTKLIILIKTQLGMKCTWKDYIMFGKLLQVMQWETSPHQLSLTLQSTAL